eukprot:jgi/Chrzof1/11188/Cz05g27120.t1
MLNMALKQKDKGKTTPVLDRSKASDISMAVLKRIDPEVEEVLANAGHVCLYRMSCEDQQWQRKNIEGSLFLLKRRSQPRFQMIVLNKLSTDNYMETIHGGLELEVNSPYLMYTHGNNEIHGIWFYESADLEKFGNLLKKILLQLPKPDTAPGAAAVAEPAAASPPPATAAAASGTAAAVAAAARSGGDDAFWDKSVEVTEDTMPASTLQAVPNNLLSGSSASIDQVTSSTPTNTGFTNLLRQAQQRHAAGGATHKPTPPIPMPAVPNSTSTPATTQPATASPGKSDSTAPSLLTPSFFQQQLSKAVAGPAAGGGGTASGAPAPAPAPAPAAPSALTPAANGTSKDKNALHQVFSRAGLTLPPTSTLPAEKSPQVPGPVHSAFPATAAGTSPFGLPGNLPLPPSAPPQPQLHMREKVRQAFARLMQNDAFVDSLVVEFRGVGLLQ